MAYTQKPGRGNNAKTGHGLPTPFMQTEPGPKTAKALAEVTKRKQEGVTEKEYAADKKFATGTPGTGMTSGTSFNPRTNETTANPYEKKLVSQPNGDTFLVNGAGKTIEKAVFNKFKPEAVEALKKKYANEKAMTNDSRSANVVRQNERGKNAGGFNMPR
jgi:hypothetical protein